MFDQVVATHRVLRKTKKYWKSLFLDFLDVSAVNDYFLFDIWRKKHLDSIKRRKHFRHADFRANLIRQLAGIEESTPPPQGQFRRRRSSPSDPVTQMHLSAATQIKNNCRNCREVDGKQRQCVTYCVACGVHLHITSSRNCFVQYHERHFKQ